MAQAAAQSTNIGKTVNQLAIWQGRLYASYGDYGNNTGPIDIVSADLTDFAAGFSSETTLEVQQTWVFRNGLSGRLWVPYIDPIRGDFPDLSQPHAGFAFADTPGEWTVGLLQPYPEHVMDMVETAEALWACGSTVDNDGNGGVIVWKSTDRGTTWTQDLFVASTVVDPARFYCFFDWGDGSLSVAYASLDMTPNLGTYHRPADGDWTSYDDPALTHFVSDAHLFTFNGTPFQLVTNNGKNQGQVDTVRQYLTAHVRPGDEALVDEIQASLPASGIDVWVSDDGERAYVVRSTGNDGVVLLGDTAGNWAPILDFDASSGGIAGLGIAVDETNGFIYLSGSDAQVAQFALPA